MCFSEKDGKFLWQLTHDKLAAGRVNDWPRQGICSSPAVDGDRMFYVSNRCELVCADTEGFLDGENDGPFTEETLTDKIDGDIVWSLDMIGELGVFPHNLATSSPVYDDKYVYLVTSNGVDEGHIVLPDPYAQVSLPSTKRPVKLSGSRRIRERTSSTASGRAPRWALSVEFASSCSRGATEHSIHSFRSPVSCSGLSSATRRGASGAWADWEPGITSSPRP